MQILSITYSLRALCLALLQGSSVVNLADELLILAGFCGTLIPLSLCAFRVAMCRVRSEGSLARF